MNRHQKNEEEIGVLVEAENQREAVEVVQAAVKAHTIRWQVGDSVQVNYHEL
jgi:hypothetical protein